MGAQAFFLGPRSSPRATATSERQTWSERRDVWTPHASEDGRTLTEQPLRPGANQTKNRAPRWWRRSEPRSQRTPPPPKKKKEGYPPPNPKKIEEQPEAGEAEPQICSIKRTALGPARIDLPTGGPPDARSRATRPVGPTSWAPKVPQSRNAGEKRAAGSRPCSASPLRRAPGTVGRWRHRPKSGRAGNWEAAGRLGRGFLVLPGLGSFRDPHLAVWIGKFGEFNDSCRGRMGSHPSPAAIQGRERMVCFVCFVCLRMACLFVFPRFGA